jgi:hypothetical protein
MQKRCKQTRKGHACSVFFVLYGLWFVNLEAVAFVPYGLVLCCLRLLCYLIMEYGLKLTDKRV